MKKSFFGKIAIVVGLGILVLIVLVVASGPPDKKSDSNSVITEYTAPETQLDEGEEAQLLENLKTAATEENFESFAGYLQQAYENGLNLKAEFSEVERDLYVATDNKYFIPGDYEKSLEYTSIVYAKVPTGGRFKYLRILSLEALGRKALEAGDLDKADNYATQILQMEFRLEGSNLLADTYIKKINANIVAGGTEMAIENLRKIMRYEVSEDRVAGINKLKKDLNVE